MKREIIIIAHDIRSTHNVGALLRTADGLGLRHVYFTGYTPYPTAKTDERLPHIAEKLSKQIHKTALGAETMVAWSHIQNVHELLQSLKSQGYTVAALEQDPEAIPLPAYNPPQKIALLLGREVEGIDAELLRLCDVKLEIPMTGRKESFNVVQAAAMALYHCRFVPMN
jgi:23S rRNA (guanosine2251-2'-O)-methyltransferase